MKASKGKGVEPSSKSQRTPKGKGKERTKESPKARHIQSQKKEKRQDINKLQMTQKIGALYYLLQVLEWAP